MYRAFLEDAIEASRRSIVPFRAVSGDQAYFQGADDALSMLNECGSIEDVRALQKVLEKRERDTYLEGALSQVTFVLKRLKALEPLLAMQKLHKEK